MHKTHLQFLFSGMIQYAFRSRTASDNFKLTASQFLVFCAVSKYIINVTNKCSEAQLLNRSKKYKKNTYTHKRMHIYTHFVYIHVYTYAELKRLTMNRVELKA